MIVMVVHRDGRDDPALPVAGFADRPGLEGHPRGRAGGRRQRHQHRHDEAPGVRARRDDGRPGRRLQRLEADDRLARTSSCSRSRSRSWRWSSSAGWATSGASPLGAFIVYLIQVVLLKQLNTSFEELTPGDRPGPDPSAIADINFVDYQFLLFGIALVLMMLFRPEGLFPSQTPAARAPHRRGPGGPPRTTRGSSEPMGEAPGVDELTRRHDDEADAMTDVLSAENVTKRFGGLSRSTTSTSRSRRARSSASSARTAPARRRSSTSSPGSTTRPAGRIEFHGRTMIAKAEPGLARAVPVAHARRRSSALVTVLLVGRRRARGDRRSSGIFVDGRSRC